MEIQLNISKLVCFIVYVFFISCSENNIYEEEIEFTKKDKKTDNELFVINSVFNDKLTITFEVNSVNKKGKARNLILFGIPKSGEKYHLAQWEIKKSNFQDSYKIPDSLFYELSALRFCLVYFNPEIMKPEIIECKESNLPIHLN